MIIYNQQIIISKDERELAEGQLWYDLRSQAGIRLLYRIGCDKDGKFEHYMPYVRRSFKENGDAVYQFSSQPFKDSEDWEIL